MSIADKQMLINSITSILSDKVTAAQLDCIMGSITETLSCYSLERVTTQTVCTDMLDAFLSAKRVEGRSEKTIERYRYCIGCLLRYTSAPIQAINVYHIRAFFANEKSRGIQDSTLEGFRSVYSSFFGWLHTEGLIQTNPCSNVSPIKCEKKIRKPFTDIDLEKLKEYCGSDRNRAMLFFLLSTGCRISEMCGLNRDDINLITMECIVHGKGNKQRTVFLSEVAAMMVTRYLESRKDDLQALFVGKGSERMTPGGVRFMLRKVAKLAGVDNCHPHRFRRTLATNLIDRGMSIQEVAYILGHEKLDTTMKYVYVAKDNVKNAYKKYA